MCLNCRKLELMVWSWRCFKIQSYSKSQDWWCLHVLLYSVDVVSGVPLGCALGSLLFLLYITDLPGLLKNVLVSYADDSTLFCRIPHPRDRAFVTAPVNDDLAMISDWCSRWGICWWILARQVLISKTCAN